MKRIITIILVLIVGGLVLWEVVAQGTKTWTRYGLMKESLPSLMTFWTPTLTLRLLPIIISLVMILLTAITFFRSRRFLGIIPLSELRRHILICGPTGSGKTTIAKDIIRRAIRENVKVTILDWKGEYVEYIDGATIFKKINLWDVDGRSPSEKAVIAVEMLREITRDIADMSSASATLLLKELVRIYSEKVPTTKDVVDRVDRFMQTALSERRLAEANMAAAILRRLYWLLVDEERPDENIHGSPDVVIYDLSSTGSNYLKTLYSLTVLTKKYYEALRRGPTDELSEITIDEECQNYVRNCYLA